MCCLHVKSSRRFNFHPFKNPLLCKLNNLCSPMPTVMSFTIIECNCNNSSLPFHFSVVFVAPLLSSLALPNPHMHHLESSLLIPWRHCLFYSGYLWKNMFPRLGFHCICFLGIQYSKVGSSLLPFIHPFLLSCIHSALTDGALC